MNVQNTPPLRTLSALLEQLQEKLATMQNVTTGTLIEALHERGIGFVLLIFAAPMALPLPVPPGINILLATPLLLITTQQALGRHTLWLPDKIKSKPLSRDKLEGLIAGLVPWIKKVEFLVRPRLSWITWDGPSRFFGLLGVLMALTVCIPVPLTNTVPSLGISLMAVGVIMRDGLAVLVGALIGVLWITMLAWAVLHFGPEAFDIIKETIKSFL